MRIIFFGASDLGYECCKALLDRGHSIVAIFTIPENFNIKYKGDVDKRTIKNYLFKDFREFEVSNNIPVYEVEGNMQSYKEIIQDFKPDFILAIGWYYLIQKDILSLATKGAAGIHGSLLPKYRGNAPFVWAMINGEKETGVSFFYFDDGIDTGDIIGQHTIPILPNDTIKEILEKAKVASIHLLLDNLPKIAKGEAKRKKQDDSSATYFPKRVPEDGLIDWTWDKERIKNFIKAQTKPYPGAYTIIADKKIVIWNADINLIP